MRSRLLLIARQRHFVWPAAGAADLAHRCRAGDEERGLHNGDVPAASPCAIVLLVVQIALCTLLVTASLVAVRGMQRSLRAPLGVEPQGVTLATTDLDMANLSGDQVLAVAEAHDRRGRAYSWSDGGGYDPAQRRRR